MKCDVISSGVGGQGILSVSAIIAWAALEEGLFVKQSEEHGMSQRGGTVVTHLRLSDRPIHSDLVPRGRADLIISLEPMECQRYLDYLSPQGRVLSSINPVNNIPVYPDLDSVLNGLRKLPRTQLIDASSLAREAGSGLANNMVMVGAASSVLPVKAETLTHCIRQMFSAKGSRIVEINLEAFALGREAVSAPCP